MEAKRTLRVLIVTPAPRGSRKGNRVTAERWARLLRELGCQVGIADNYHGQAADLLIALHARKSAAAVRDFRRSFPDRPIVLALTGTDLYGDIRTHQAARQSLEWATRLVVLQAAGLQELTARLRQKARVIVQSASPSRRPAPVRTGWFDVGVVGHLRAVKDPFRTALAARLLPRSSRLHVWHFGGALTPAAQRRAEREQQVNPRYTWLGELTFAETQRRIAGCRLIVQSSRTEGGANVISEAVVAGVPVLASRVPGNVGLLGRDYPGYFPCGETRQLAQLLGRAENDQRFWNRLKTAVEELIPQFTPDRERGCWRTLLEELPA